MKPTLFIGSSTQRLPIACALKEVLSDCADVTIWNQAPEFALGYSLLRNLIKVGEVYDFALLVFGADDCTMMDNEWRPSVRDNVLFELGLFMGHMGRERAFWLSPRGPKEPRFSSDLDGIVHLEFDEPELTDHAAILNSLAEPRARVCNQITKLGYRTSQVVPVRRALCLASSQYKQERFQQDIEIIHNFFSKGAVTAEQGVTVDRFSDYFSPGKKWDMVHLGLYVDEATQRLLFDTSSGIGYEGSLPIKAVTDMIQGCGAALVVIITCDSLRFGAQLARFTNVIAGYRSIKPPSALNWAKIFYEALSFGMPISQAFDKAQDRADPGLILLVRRDVRFRRLTCE